MTISETIAYLQQFSKSGKPVKDLSRMQSLLRRIGQSAGTIANSFTLPERTGKVLLLHMVRQQPLPLVSKPDSLPRPLSGTIKTGFRSMEQIFQTTVFVHSANR